MGVLAIVDPVKCARKKLKMPKLIRNFFAKPYSYMVGQLIIGPCDIDITFFKVAKIERKQKSQNIRSLAIELSKSRQLFNNLPLNFYEFLTFNGKLS